MKWRDQNHLDIFLYGSVMQSMERLLHALMKLYEEDSECRLTHLGDLVNEVADLDLLDWFGHVRLIDCTCEFVLLSLQIGQAMIEGLLLLLRDPDYQVRFFLARQIWFW